MYCLNLQKVNRLLIIRLSSLGDILLTTPLLRSLKKQYPNIIIDFLLRADYTDVLKHNPFVTDIFTYTDNNSTVLELKKHSYDLIIDLQNNFRSRKITRKLPAEIVRFKKPTIRKFLLVYFKLNFLKVAIPIPVRYAQLFKDFHLDNGGLDLFLGPEAKNYSLNGERFIGLCPGSRHYTKQWPVDYYVNLGNMINSTGVKVLIFGGRQDFDVCERISEQIPGSINLCNDNDLLKTANYMKKCSVIVCNDSGLMHTATAVKVPVIAIFGSTVREFGFAPYNSENLVLENNLLFCRPCSHIGRSKCPLGHFKCMKRITVEFVYEKIYNYCGFQ